MPARLSEICKAGHLNGVEIQSIYMVGIAAENGVGVTSKSDVVLSASDLSGLPDSDGPMIAAAVSQLAQKDDSDYMNVIEATLEVALILEEIGREFSDLPDYMPLDG